MALTRLTSSILRSRNLWTVNRTKRVFIHYFSVSFNHRGHTSPYQSSMLFQKRITLCEVGSMYFPFFFFLVFCFFFSSCRGAKSTEQFLWNIDKEILLLKRFFFQLFSYIYNSVYLKCKLKVSLSLT